MKYKSTITSLTGVIALASFNSALAMDPVHLEHPHSAGTVMLEYKFMRMYMNDLQKGSDSYSIDDAKIAGYERIPESMAMDMHMFMPMYNITKDISVMAMMSYLSNTMDMQMKMGTMYHSHEMETSGMGDTELSMSYKNTDYGLAASLGVSVPTGSITEEVTMSGVTMPAPYAMQLGSGTNDITASLMYLGAYFDTRYGAKVAYTHRLGENDQGYTLGNKAEAMTWVRKPMGPVVLDAELSYTRWGDVEGKDKDVAAGMTDISSAMTSITHIGSNYGGTRVGANVGVAVPVGMSTVSLDVGMPVYQELNGVQMKQTWSLSASISAMF